MTDREALEIATRPWASRLTGTEVRALCAYMGWDRARTAELFGVTVNTVTTWEGRMDAPAMKRPAPELLLRYSAQRLAASRLNEPVLDLPGLHEKLGS